MIYTILHTFLNYASHYYEAAQIDQVLVKTNFIHFYNIITIRVSLGYQNQIKIRVSKSNQDGPKKNKVELA